MTSAYFLLQKKMADIVRIKLFLSLKNNNICHIIDHIRSKGYLWKSSIALCKWKVTWNYKNSPFNKKTPRITLLKFRICLKTTFFNYLGHIQLPCVKSGQKVITNKELNKKLWSLFFLLQDDICWNLFKRGKSGNDDL